jgi:S-adenosylmethionine:tRNA ribosyltransferase-isomerase
MIPANYTAERKQDELKLMCLTSDSSQIMKFKDIENIISEKDLLVMNTSATLPASLWAFDQKTEIRLAAFAGRNLNDFSTWWAISFGEGSWHDPTENRGPAPYLTTDELIKFTPALSARVLEVNDVHHRLIKIKFEGPRILDEIYRHGRPIQYSYHRENLNLWDVQTLLSQIPISVEAPSSLFGFSYDRFFSLKAQKSYLLHGAGLSSTGDESLDKLLPLPEYFEIPEATLEAITRTRKNGGKIIAVGTTVARALETFGRTGISKGLTNLKLGSQTPVRVVDALLTGFHEPGTSHFSLEEALLNTKVLQASFELAEQNGFVGHEYGDLVLVG